MRKIKKVFITVLAVSLLCGFNYMQEAIYASNIKKTLIEATFEEILNKEQSEVDIKMNLTYDENKVSVNKIVQPDKQEIGKKDEVLLNTTYHAIENNTYDFEVHYTNIVTLEEIQEMFSYEVKTLKIEEEVAEEEKPLETENLEKEEKKEEVIEEEKTIETESLEKEEMLEEKTPLKEEAEAKKPLEEVSNTLDPITRAATKIPIKGMVFWNDETKNALNSLGYSGNPADIWLGSKLYWGVNGTSPMMWRILNTNETGYGQSNGVLIMQNTPDEIGSEAIKFNPIGAGNVYMGSILESYIDRKFTETLNSKEQEATLSSSRSETAYAAPYETWTDNISNKQWFAPTMRMMTTESYGYPNKDNKSGQRTFNRSVWLSSADASNPNSVGAIQGKPLNEPEGGLLFDSATQNSRGVMSASQLNPNSILFVSNAVDSSGKKTGTVGPNALVAVGANVGREYKLTLKDTSQRVTVTSATYNNLNLATINYDKTGEGTTLSAIVTDSTGSDIIAYGQLANIASGSLSNQTATVQFPRDFVNAGYKLKIFTEITNGNYKSDYASELEEVELELSGPNQNDAFMVWDDNAREKLKPSTYGGGFSWLGSKLYWGTNGEVPMKWRILNPSEAGFAQSDGILIMSDDVNQISDSGVRFDESSNSYIGSNLAAFFDEKFSLLLSKNEQEATLRSAKQETNYEIPEINRNYTDNISGSYWFAPTGRMMMTESYGYPGSEGASKDSARSLGDGFWLSSQIANTTNISGYVKSTGAFGFFDAYIFNRAVAASQLNPNTILFVTNAVDGKKTGNVGKDALLPITTAGNGEYKLTLKDNTQSVIVNSALINDSNLVTIKYNKTGVGTKLSAIVTDRTGNNVISYGQLANISASNLSNQTTTVQLPSDFYSNGYKLKIFTEIYNGDKKTDYASALVEVNTSVPKYNVTFNSNGGSTVYSQDIEENKTVTKPIDPTKTGYTFAGWFKESTLTTAWNFTNGKVTQAMTLYAKWTPTPYTIGYNLNGGTNNSLNPTSYNIETATFTLKVPTRTGYTFLGWTGANGATAQPSVSIDKGSNGNKTYTANWKINEYTVTYESNGGSDVATVKADYNTLITQPPNPTKAGTTFAGWYTDIELKQAWNFSTNKVIGDMTLYAKWTTNSYTVSFNMNGGLPIITNQSIAHNSTVSKPANPAKEGYTFGGWFKENTLANEWNFTTDKVTSATTLYAKWTPSPYTIGYSLDGGTNNSLNPTSYNIETATFTLKAPTKTGYTFLGWTGSNGNTEELNVSIDKGSTGNKAYTANWKINEYTVTYESNGGSDVAAVTADYNKTITKPTDPTKAGFIFDGWYTNEGLTTEWNFTTNKVIGNMTLYAKWTTNNYTVSFNSNGGTTVVDQSIAYNSTVLKPTNPAKEGYEFRGWYIDSVYSSEWSFGSDCVTGDMTLYAKWISKPDKTSKSGFMLWNDDTEVHLNPPGYSGVSTAAWGGSKLYWGVNGTTPMKWRILNTSETGLGVSSGGVLIMHDDVDQIGSETVQFDTSSNVYNTSNLATYVDRRFTETLNTKEQGATLASSRSETKYKAPYLTWTDNIIDKEWFAPTMRIMYTESYGYPNNDKVNMPRKFGYPIWLSSADTGNSFSAGRVRSDGTLYNNIISYGTRAMSASQLNPDSILFVSNALDANGKKTGTVGPLALAEVNANASGEYKLTLEDTSQAVSVKSSVVNTSNLATIKYSKTGNGTTLSAIVTDKDGNNIISYGQLATIASGDLTDQTATVQLPADFFTTGYKLKVFTEIVNGDKKTDYASKLMEPNLKFSYAVEFNTNGGTTIPEQSIINGEKVIKPTDPTKAGYRLSGWYTDDTYKTEWDFDTDIVTADMTLYAKWEAIKTNKAGLMYWNEDAKFYLNPPGYSGVPTDAWAGSKLYWGVNGSTPMKWRILNTNETGYGVSSGGVLIMHDDVNQIGSETVQFNSTETVGNAYMKSNLATYIDVKLGRLLDSKEEGATLESSRSETNYEFGEYLLSTDNISRKKWFAPTVRMMSTESYGYSNISISNASRELGGVIWLASENRNAYEVGYVREDGVIGHHMVTNRFHTASASQLNPNSILFISNALDTNGKKTGTVGENALESVSTNANGEYKLTIKDTRQTVTVNSTLVNASNLATIKYSKTGNGTTLSAIVTDKDGNNIISYGQLATIASGDLTDQTATVQLPADFFTTGYKLKVFTEIVNGDKKTDYASGIIEANPALSHAVTFEIDGGTTIPEQSIVDGEKVIKPTDPTKAGYRFGGWYTNDTYKTEWNFDTDTVTADMTLYAKWNEIYQLSFNANTGVGAMKDMEFIKEDSLTLPANTFTKDNYAFSGWNTKANGTGVAYNNEATLTNMLASDLTLYATWKTQTPTLFVDIPKGLYLLDDKAEKTASKEDFVKIVKNVEDAAWYPDEDIQIRTSTDITLTNTDTTDVYDVEVFKADDTRYTDSLTPLAILNVKDEMKQSSKFTLKTPISYAKVRGSYTGTMNFTIEFKPKP